MIATFTTHALRNRPLQQRKEGDLIVGNHHGSAIGTLVDRQTRMVRLLRPASLHTALVTRMREILPGLLCSITWDQGNRNDPSCRHPLLGEWDAQWGSSVPGIDLAEGPQSGAARSSTVVYDPFHELYTWGRVCYPHSWWNLLRYRYTAKGTGVYSFSVRVLGERLEALGKSDMREDLFPMVETEHGTAC